MSEEHDALWLHEIRKVEAERDRYREALEQIADYFKPDDCDCDPEHHETCVNHLARVALSQQEGRGQGEAEQE